MEWLSPKKVNVFNWQTNLNRIPTCDSLLKRQIPLQATTCFLCNEEMETVDHMFTSCHFSAAPSGQNWDHGAGYNRSLHFSFKDIMDIPYTLRGDAEFKKGIHVLFMASMWCIWKHRNQILFDKIAPSVNGILCEILVLTALWLKARSRKGGEILLRMLPRDNG